MTLRFPKTINRTDAVDSAALIPSLRDPDFLEVRCVLPLMSPLEQSAIVGALLSSAQSVRPVSTRVCRTGRRDARHRQFFSIQRLPGGRHTDQRQWLWKNSGASHLRKRDTESFIFGLDRHVHPNQDSTASCDGLSSDRRNAGIKERCSKFHDHRSSATHRLPAAERACGQVGSRTGA